MIDYVIAAIMGPILGSISILTMLALWLAFMGMFKLCDKLKPKPPLYTMRNPEKFWDAKYFVGYDMLVGKLGNNIVIFSSDRSQYKLIPERDFCAANPDLYDPCNKSLTWKGSTITRDEHFVGWEVLPL